MIEATSDQSLIAGRDVLLEKPPRLIYPSRARLALRSVAVLAAFGYTF